MLTCLAERSLPSPAPGVERKDAPAQFANTRISLRKSQFAYAPYYADAGRSLRPLPHRLDALNDDFRTEISAPAAGMLKLFSVSSVHRV